jgi:general secretion pathway protein M
MSLRDRFNQLETRERRLLGILLALFGAFVLLMVPIGVSAVLGGKRDENDALREVIAQLQQDRAAIVSAHASREAIVQRYARPAPALAGLLEQYAGQSSLEIPESQDRPVTPHGKKYEERSTKIVLRRVGMYNLAKFMERIEQSGHPMAVDKLNIRKRGTENDSFDVEMTVSAFDRKPDKKPAQRAEGAEGESP